MHQRSSVAVAAVASISILMLAGCGSGRSTAAVAAKVAGSGAVTSATSPATAPTTTAATAGSMSTTPTASTTPTTPTTPTTASSAPTGTTATTPQSAGSSSTAAGGPVTGWDSCSAVDVRVERLPGVAGGRTYFDLIVTNHGSADCTLPAQPKLGFLAATFKPIQVRFSSDPSAQAYKLGPNLSAAMSVGYSSASMPPCDEKIAWVRVVSPGHDVPFDGRMHCNTDGYFENHWTPGTYAPAE